VGNPAGCGCTFRIRAGPGGPKTPLVRVAYPNRPPFDRLDCGALAVRRAFLVPGQGAQTAGVLHALPEHEAVRATFRAAPTALRLNPADMDSGAVLNSTVAVQLGVLLAAVA